jgi:uncharacterized membrane protein YgcG
VFDWIRALFDRSRSLREDQSSTSVYAPAAVDDNKQGDSSGSDYSGGSESGGWGGGGDSGGGGGNGGGS